MSKRSESTQTESLNSSQENSKRSSLKNKIPAYDKITEATKGIDFIFDHFPRKIHTLQFLNAKTQSAPVRCYPDTKAGRKAAVTTALAFNKKGYDIFFMVNEGDGKVHKPKNVTPRSHASVKNLSSFFIDTDKCPIERVEEYLRGIKLTPSIIIESSPGRFHLYFLFTPLAKTDDTIERWQHVQHMLHRLGDAAVKNPSKKFGTDGTMHDYSKVLRVPGFMHVNKLHLVNVKENYEISYSFDHIYQLTNAHLYPKALSERLKATPKSNITPGEVHPLLSGTGIIDSGERYSALQSVSLHLANTTPRKEAYRTFKQFVIQRLDNEDGTYTHGKELSPKAKGIFSSAFEKVSLEAAAKDDELERSLEDADKEPTSPWVLPDEFYLRAPNGFGDVIAQVMKYSLYPYAPLAFGTFLTGLSILKSRTTLTPHGSSPALYTLNVAISGLGKSDPMTLLQNLFVHNGLGRLIGNKIRSDRGIYTHLEGSQGTGLFILDEVAPLLKAIQQDDANTHHAYIAEALLQLYSSGAVKGLSFGKLGASGNRKGEKEIVIDNPMVAVLGYTVPMEFERLFNSDSVAKGLFQRFLPIVTEPTDVMKSPDADKTAIIKSSLFEVDPAGAAEIDDEGNTIEPLVATERVQATYTPQAMRLFNELERYYRQKLIESARGGEESALSGLYSRVVEQIERVATVLSKDEIDLHTLEYAQEFIESRHKATLASAERVLLRGPGTRAADNEEALVKTIAKLCKAEEVNTVMKREVYHHIRRRFKNMQEFDQCVSEAHSMGRIKVVKDYMPQDRKRSKKAVGLRLAEIPDF